MIILHTSIPIAVAVGGQAAARRPKLRVERRPFLTSKAVIFGVNSTGPHILGVKTRYDIIL